MRHFLSPPGAIASLPGRVQRGALVGPLVAGAGGPGGASASLAGAVERAAELLSLAALADRGEAVTDRAEKEAERGRKGQERGRNKGSRGQGPDGRVAGGAIVQPMSQRAGGDVPSGPRFVRSSAE